MMIWSSKRPIVWGEPQNYSYDKNARLVSEIWKDDQGATVDTRSFGYDVAGNLLTASNDAGAYSFTYDALTGSRR